MELEVDLADAELDELLAAGSRAAKKRQVELAELKEKYEAQLKSLKDLVGDYTDRMELQQNSYKRLTAIAESAQTESLALKARAQVLEDRLGAANEQLAKVQSELEATTNPFASFFKLFQR